MGRMNQIPNDEKEISPQASKNVSSRALSRLEAFGGWVENHPWAMLLILCVLALGLPCAYVVETPGPTLDVLGTNTLHGSVPASADTGATQEAIAIGGAKTYKPTGKLLMVTVNASGLPTSPDAAWEAAAAFFSRQATVLPSEVVYPATSTPSSYEKQERSEMSGAQSDAATAAISFMKKRGLLAANVNPKVTMNARSVGGPSAGMMFALGTIDKLTPGNLANGKIIAGTGTISDSGAVGKIGGIQLKMIGARDSGATWFLAPAGNCSSVVGHIPAGLHVVAVSSLSQAYDAVKAIGAGQGASLAGCPVSSAK